MGANPLTEILIAYLAGAVAVYVVAPPGDKSLSILWPIIALAIAIGTVVFLLSKTGLEILKILIWILDQRPGKDP